MALQIRLYLVSSNNISTQPDYRRLVNISKSLVFEVREVFESAGRVVVLRLADSLGSQPVAALVLQGEVKPQAQDDENEERVAAEMCGEGDEVLGSIPRDEDLGALWDCRDMSAHIILPGTQRF